LAGVLSVERTDGGGRLSRLPLWVRDQVSDPALWVVASMPAGARVEFTSSTTALELDVEITHLQLGAAPVTAKAFDLVINDEVIDVARSSDGPVIHLLDDDVSHIEFRAGSPTTIRFEGLALTDKRIEVWWPHNALIELRGLRLDDDATVSTSETARRRWVHYGSSISHSVEVPRPTQVWPVEVARRAGVNLHNLGMAGECHLDQFVARTIGALALDAISFEAGTNILAADSMRERTFVPALHGFLDTLREHHPEVPIIVMTPIIAPAFETTPGPGRKDAAGYVRAVERPAALSVGTLTVRHSRDLIERVVAQRQREDANLHLISGLDLFGPDESDNLPDGLHPSIDGYHRIGKRFFDLAFASGPFGI
jgi:hypothetical protein